MPLIKKINTLHKFCSEIKIKTLLRIILFSLLGGWITYTLIPPNHDNIPNEQRISPVLPESNIFFNKQFYDLKILVNPLRHDKKKLKKNIKAGAIIYFQNCFFCHGDKLDGEGHFAKGLTPSPTNFLNPDVINRMKEPYLFWRIATGGKGLPEKNAPWDSAMPTWHNMLKEEEIWQVILFLYDYTGQESDNDIQTSTLSSSSDAINNGLRIYLKRCQWCHGEKGNGDGPAAKFLNPPPRDFTMGVYKYVSSISDGFPIASDEDIFRSISEGMPGTAMPGWKDILSEKDRWDLVATLKSLTDMFDDTPIPEKILTAPPVTYSTESLKKGEEIYYHKAKCYECHGDGARGNGFKKLKEDGGARVYPRNHRKHWTFRGGNAVTDIFTRVTLGIPGTPMPSFSKSLTHKERWHVANYVKSLGDDSHRPLKGRRVLKAQFINGKLPDKINDSIWKTLPLTPYFLTPNIITKKRLFMQTNSEISARALYNKKELVILLEWTDRTKSLPGDKAIAEISEKEFFKDAVAIQFPNNMSNRQQKPYFGHGSVDKGVNIWYWDSGSFSSSQKTLEIHSTGLNRKKQIPEDIMTLAAKGIYRKGLWKVLFRHPLKTKNKNDIRFESGEYIPIAFANWDGSNGEKGSKHTLTSWHWILLSTKNKNIIWDFLTKIGLVPSRTEVSARD